MIWQRFTLEILLEKNVWVHIFFIMVKFINSPTSPNKSSPLIYRFTVFMSCNLQLMIDTIVNKNLQ